jgi:hypothetical protein
MNGHEQLVEQLTQLEEADFAAVVENARRRRIALQPPLPDQPEALDRDGLAGWYALRHLSIEPTLREVVYLPHDAPPDEIRLLEVNVLLRTPDDSPVEAIDFGIDADLAPARRVLVADISPGQWERIKAGTLALPKGWAVEGNTIYGRKRKA